MLAVCVGVGELRGQGVGLLVGLDDVRLPAVPRLPPLQAGVIRDWVLSRFSQQGHMSSGRMSSPGSGE